MTIKQQSKLHDAKFIFARSAEEEKNVKVVVSGNQIAYSDLFPNTDEMQKRFAVANKQKTK